MAVSNLVNFSVIEYLASKGAFYESKSVLMVELDILRLSLLVSTEVSSVLVEYLYQNVLHMLYHYN